MTALHRPTTGSSVGSEGQSPVYPAFPGYEILKELGRGGMGVVYQARQAGLGRMVALKMLRAGAMGPKAMRQFRNETESLARLHHPSFVQIHEIGEYQDWSFISMEFVEGETLARKLGDNPQDQVATAVLLATVARALHAAHELGIVHRDLKPGNLFLTLEGMPRIADCGLSQQRDYDEWLQGLPCSGVVLGTPEYMAPEQAQHRFQDITPRTDVYALGVVLYKMLCGRSPFKGATLMETVVLIVTHEPVPPRSMVPSILPQLENICMKCLCKDPSQRHGTALALAEELHRFAQDEGESRRKKLWQFSR